MSGAVLGIETSCDETAVGIVRDGVVLANLVATQIPLHRRFGGVVPEIASRNHLLTILPTVEAALAACDLKPADLASIAVCNRPGLIGALLVGVQTAKTLALCWDVPLVGVHHIEAHAWAVHLRPPGHTAADWPRPALPLLALAVSGGHTSLLRVSGPGRVELLGHTLDDAAGEAFDKFGKILGLPYPAGPEIDRLAPAGAPRRFDLPRGMRGRDDLQFSFSGLKTAGRLIAERLVAEGAALEGVLLADLCASYQDAAVQQLVDVTVRAALRHGLGDVVIAGGVAANRQLRRDLTARCAAAGLTCWPTPLAWCTDNGAMIAGLGEALLQTGERADRHELDAIASTDLRFAASASRQPPRSRQGTP